MSNLKTNLDLIKDKLNISNENNVYYAILDDYTNIKDNYNKALETSKEIKGID